MRRQTAAATCIVLATATTACGRERIRPPDTVKPEAPLALAAQGFPQEGLFLERPSNWPFLRGRAPLVASATSGTATVALWRYLRSEPLPREDELLDAAQSALQEAVRARDGSFAVERAERVEVDGAPAIQLLGTETIAGRKRRVRSTHVYAKGAEVVLDAYAPPEEFARVDETVFAPILESLRIDPPEGTP
ncbi:MAG TPA: hypothetical protein VHF89_17105 [Solirubrobacteraceae bacterium]|nr:hypothetical protein [Solirubrobacteraceae bacterium]